MRRASKSRPDARPTVPAGAEARDQGGGDDAGADGAILQGRGAVIQRNQAREAGAQIGRERAQPVRAVGRQVDRKPAGHHRVHHQPMAEAGGGGAQHALAQHRAMRQHQGEGGIVADGADIAEVVGEPFQFREQRAQPHRARRGFGAERGLGRARESERVGHRAVAADAAGDAGGGGQGGAGEQGFDALVGVAEALFQPHHRLAVAGEAEMSGLDNAGVHGPHRDLMQVGTFDREERVSGRVSAMQEPGPSVGQADRVEPVQIARGPFEAQRGDMHAADRGVASVRAVAGQMPNDRSRRTCRGADAPSPACGRGRGEGSRGARTTLTPTLSRERERGRRYRGRCGTRALQHRQMHAPRLAPQSEQGRLPGR